ncbi:putative late blight resistance protein homolog R1A-3 isoform X2 [Nicotiana tomentosiformis]|uniref:putative late blight resistance protein homolog R1A-3 isoform X2 n=1 Tax=Nicotiana tomentosiformis TaxID=4098 RepID=UPI00144650AD|nr:putative late blight resistance protein homolog R1A-3 isoform X3 [Nicotiana tomentosiformis]
MAYAATYSLMHTLEQLLQCKLLLIYRSCIQQHLESAFQSLSSLQVFLEYTSKEIKDIETLKTIEKRIRDIVYKAEERVDSALRRIIILVDQQKRERACKSFNEELQKVEKEVDSLRKELMEIEFIKHGTKSAEASTSTSSKRYATEQHTVVGMKDDFNTILDRLTAQTDQLTVIPVVGMGGIDMEIGVSKLIKLWIAELFVRARSNKKLEMVAEEYLEELIDRSLILAGTRRANGKMKTCKIHDFLRQLCIREAQIENCVHVLSDSDHISSESIKYQRRAMLSLGNHWNHLYVPRHWSGLTSTTSSLVFTGYSFQVYLMPQFVSQFKLLKVLDVSSINYNFSWVISKLAHLRYVAAYINEAPSLAKLWNLQTIILRNFTRGDFHLPLEIWTMSEIRHLDIVSDI